MKISKIERVSKSKPLYHLYSSDGSLLMTITEETLLHFNLQKGQFLPEELQEEIFHFDQVQRCLEQAYRYLSRRNHFQKELMQKLRSKKFAKEIIEQAITILNDKGYLDDSNLIHQFIRDAIHLKHYGPNLIKRKLFERGVEIDQIERALEQHYSPHLQIQIGLNLAGKKLKSLKGLPVHKQKQKLTSFLQQRGFGWESIQTIVEQILQNHS